MVRFSFLGLFLWAMTTVSVHGDLQSKRVKPMQVTGTNGFTVKWKGDRRIRYWGLRFPQEGVLFASEAAQLNRSLVEGKRPRIEFEDDGNDPVLDAIVYVEDELGREICLNEEFLRRGLALVNRTGSECPHTHSLAKAQQEARAPEPRGMWKDHEVLLEAKTLAESGNWKRSEETLSSLMKKLEGKDGLLTDLPPLVDQWAEGKLLQADVAYRLGAKNRWRLHTNNVMEEAKNHPQLNLPLAVQLTRWGLKAQAAACLKSYGSWEGAAVHTFSKAAHLAYALQDWPLTCSLYTHLAGMRELEEKERKEMAHAKESQKKVDNVKDIALAAMDQKDFMKAWRSIRSLEQTGGVSKEELTEFKETFQSQLEDEISSLISQGRISDARVLTSLPMAGSTASGVLGELSREVDRHLAEWQQVLDLNAPEAYRTYLEGDPPQELRKMAESKLAVAEEAQKAFREALGADTEEAYRDFLQKWPASREAKLAKARLLERMPEESQEDTLVPQDPQMIAKRCIPGVLFLKFTKGDTEGVGTAFVISDKGYALTAAHCVRDPETGDYYDTIQTVRPATPEKIRSLTYRPSFDYARVIKIHRDYDVALIKVPFREQMLPLALGNSDQVKMLDSVLVIGHPYGLDYTVTTGRINNILKKEMRDHRGRKSMFTLLQTDAAVNPGNSGGPLIDSQGLVIGVCSASYRDARSEGLHFFVPINKAAEIIP